MKDWTLFLDRDGVINERIVGDYVKTPATLVLREDFVKGMKILAPLFRRTIIVTNQQGIAKDLMTEEDLVAVHQSLLQKLAQEGIFIDKIYHCPHLEGSHCGCRKPETGMAKQAKSDFPEIDFHKSMMIGDSLSDILFGNKLGMKTVLITNSIPKPELESPMVPDFYSPSIQQFAESIN
ncbi:HAD family hydrolase [Bacteroidales bacterium OttesenSCG-928-C03]|nr:HAD family hydrolase [Bacteroidales bacterium OttesenSCG-928-C03]